MRNSFIFYRSFFEAIKPLPETDRLKIYDAICEFSLNNQQPDLQGVSSGFFTLIKPQLEANNKRFKNGSEPKTKQTGSKPEAKTKRKLSKVEANNNVNVNDNVNIIIAFFNSVCGTAYRSSGKSTVQIITARLNEGFGVEDMKTVISHQSKLWSGTEMEKYLRPETLFGQKKFEGYLNDANKKIVIPKSETPVISAAEFYGTNE